MDARQPDLNVQKYLTVAAFVVNMQTVIKTIGPDTTRDVFVHVESGISIERLTTLLQSLSTVQTKPDSASLCVLQNFLAQRWDAIKKTDAVYSHNPNSTINRICLILARELSIYNNKHPFDLLMPTVRNIFDYFSDKKWDSLHLNEFIMRDDDTPLSVLDAFALLEQADCSHLSNSKRLSIAEEGLLARHSDVAAAYYRILNSRIGRSDDKAIAKQNLVLFMNNLLESFTPGSTYDVTGKRRLVKMILEHVEGRKNLVAMFAHILPQKEWRTFMAIISDADYYRVMLGVDIRKTTHTETDKELDVRRLKLVEGALKLLLMPPAARAVTELNDILIRLDHVDRKKSALRAYMYCLLQAYRRMRSAQPDVKSSLGRYATSFFSVAPLGVKVCTKEEKLSACDAVEKILLEKETLRDVYIALESDDLRLHIEAIQDGQLGSFLSIIKTSIASARSLEDPSRVHDWVRIGPQA